MSRHDLVVRGALVVDGSGAPGFEGDVAVDADRITIVGEVAGAGAEELDGRGLVLAPGFIDPHTHLDANLFWDPDVTPCSSYGVTTVVTGNCGYTLAPLADDAARDYVFDALCTVEQIPRAAVDETVGFTQGTQAEYFALLDRLPVLCNFATMVGHVPVRTAVLGPDAAHERAATPEEIARVAELVAEGLRLGALGFSTDQVVGNYGPGGGRLPGQVCDDRELLAVARVLGDGPGPGLFTMAPRALLQGRAEREADLGWHLRLAETSHKPVVVGPVFDRWSEPGVGLDLVQLTAERSRPGSAGRTADLHPGVRAVDPPRHAGPPRTRAARAARRALRRVAPKASGGSRPTGRRAVGSVRKPIASNRRSCGRAGGSTWRCGGRPPAPISTGGASARSRRSSTRTRPTCCSTSRSRTTSRRSSRRAWPTTTTTGSRRWWRTRPR